MRSQDGSADVTILANDADGVTVRYRVNELVWEELRVGDRNYRTPRVKGTALPWNPGVPQLPARVIWLAIPPGASPSLVNFTPYGVNSSDAVPAPMATDIPTGDGFGSISYEEDPQYYSAVNLFPVSWAELQGPDALRDLEVVRLVIHPFRFPTSDYGTIGLDSIDVRISFQGGQTGSGGFSRPLEDEFYRGLIANWGDVAKGWKKPRAGRFEGESDPWPGGDFYKIEIEESGIYKLTYDYLTNAGIDLNAVDPRKIRIFNNGGEVLPQDLEDPRPTGPIENAVLVIGEEDGTFDPGDEIWFYGRSVNDWKTVWEVGQGRHRLEHYLNPYTERNVYWLNINPDGPEGKRMNPLDVDGVYTVNPTTTLAYTFDEKEIYALYDSYNLPRYMPNLYGDLFSGSATRTYSVNLKDVVASETARVYLKILADDTLYHQFAVYINGEFVGNTPSQKYNIETSLGIPGDVLHDGNNTLRIEQVSQGIAYLDYFELEYTRSLTTTSDRVDIFSPESDGLARYQINGLTDPWIFDITDFSAVRYVHADAFTDSCSKDDHRRYLALDPGALLTPKSIAKDRRDGDEYANLRSTLGADMLVICADPFYDVMAQYEAYRETEAPNPLQVLRVRLSDIYDEYGWGLPDPTAIRDFLKSTLPIYNWAVSPLFVLFVGDGDFDYKNKLSGSNQNWVIPFEDGSRCTDDWYSYFTPSDDAYSYPQLATGRWNAQSVEEVENLIQRVIAYENLPDPGPWQARITFVADDEYGPQGEFSSFETKHVTDTENIAENYIPGVLNVQKLYMTEYPVSYDPAGGGRRKPEANQDLMTYINEGCLLVNYMGHGNPTVWAHEHIFLQSRDLPLLSNGFKLPLFIAATCDWAYWDSPFSQSMPELMVTMAEDGAIAAIAATRTTGATANTNFLENFYLELFSVPESCRLGEALMKGKARVYSHNPGAGTNNSNAEKYHLLGDPALRLAMPQLAVYIDTVSSDTLTALDHATVAGEVRTQAGDPVSDFQGVANLQVFNPRLQVIHEFPNGSSTQYYLPGNLIFRGDASVVDGRFEAQFVVPVDIHYGDQGGRFSVLAYSDEIAGIGADDSVFFSETTLFLEDDIPPEVRVYFDSPGFRAGDPVRSTTTLYVEVSDSNGVNLTGSVGHGIVVTIDGQNPIDLTESFSYYLDSYTTGRAEHTFLPGELSPGRHTAEAIAWDAANNPNNASIDFEVVGSDEGVRVSDVLNYPNPMKRTTRFTFCLSEAATVTIKIYTVAGKLVKVIAGIPATESFNYDDERLVWDGTDEQGNRLSNGVYIYKVIADNGYGGTGEATGKLIVIR